ncbi:MAG: hypothetical protein EZS28_035617, partial [Streblomastix strix]
HADSVRITNSNFTQNEGWRTGGIFCHDITNQVLYLQNCMFQGNVAVRGTLYENIGEKFDIGNDVVLDHFFERNNVTENFVNSTSTSNYPKVGSTYIQYDFGVFDFLLDQTLADVLYVDGKLGRDVFGYGTQEQPLQTLIFAIGVSSSSTERPVTIYTSLDNFIESQFFIGGKATTIQGTIEGTGDDQKRTMLQNSNNEFSDLFTVYNGTLNLASLTVEINNNVGILNSDLIAIHLYGSGCIFSATQVIFRTAVISIRLKQQFIQSVQGCSISLSSSSFDNIQQNSEPLFTIPVQSNVTLEMLNTTINGYVNEKAEASSVVIEHYGTGVTTLTNCVFVCNVAKTKTSKIYGAALTIQFYQGNLEVVGVELANCVFDRNIGESCGAITIQGESSALTGLAITSCRFQNNVAYSIFLFPTIVHANDIYFDMANVQSILQGSQESTIFSDCVSYSATPKINYRSNTGQPVDSLLGEGANITSPATVYVSGSGSDTTGTGDITNPYQTFSQAYAHVDKRKLAQVLLQTGIFNVSFTLIDDVRIFIQGAGNLLSTITNGVQPEQGMFWLQTDTVLYIEDFEFIPSKCLSFEAPMFEVGKGSIIRLRRCSFRKQ